MNGLVAVGMSGGVDSSMAAALLLEQGYDVVGVTMRLGIAEIAERACCGETEALLARRTCAALGIPHVVLDVAEEFERAVVAPFVDAYAVGVTPNPCVWCNERVKFGALLGHARALGCERLATGHYALVTRMPDGSLRIARGVDSAKDQSYFLYRVPAEALPRLLFPLGGLTKPQVRAMAAERGLPAAERPESQDVCFTDDAAALVGRRRPEAMRPGPIVDERGERLGTHRGIARYTVGQRKGLGIGGPGGPWHVAAIDAATGTLTASARAPRRATRMLLRDAVWRATAPQAEVLAELRYRATPLPAVARFADGRIELALREPAIPSAPGQSVVLYEGQTVLGGGIMERAVGPSCDADETLR